MKLRMFNKAVSEFYLIFYLGWHGIGTGVPLPYKLSKMSIELTN